MVLFTIISMTYTAERAVGIVKWFVEESVMAFQPVREEGKHEDLTRILSIVVERYSGVATLRDLTRRHGFSETRLRELVEAFPKKIKIEATKSGPKGGAPSKIIRVLQKTGFDVARWRQNLQNLRIFYRRRFSGLSATRENPGKAAQLRLERLRSSAKPPNPLLERLNEGRRTIKILLVQSRSRRFRRFC
jgi:hypothetical protein